MKARQHPRGISLVELVIGAVIAGILIIMIVALFSKTTPLLNRVHARQSAMMQSRICMDQIVDRLRNGKARTLVISTPTNATLVPNCRVDFVLESTLPSGATAYAIYLANGSAYSLEYGPPPGALGYGGKTPRLLASNVTGLKFTGASNDPAAVYVSLRMDVPWDTSGNPTHVSTLLLQNQLVHMDESP